jgi:hypothetical protein
VFWSRTRAKAMRLARCALRQLAGRCRRWWRSRGRRRTTRGAFGSGNLDRSCRLRPPLVVDHRAGDQYRDNCHRSHAGRYHGPVVAGWLGRAPGFRGRLPRGVQLVERPMRGSMADATHSTPGLEVLRSYWSDLAEHWRSASARNSCRSAVDMSGTDAASIKPSTQLHCCPSGVAA